MVSAPQGGSGAGWAGQGGLRQAQGRGGVHDTFTDPSSQVSDFHAHECRDRFGLSSYCMTSNLVKLTCPWRPEPSLPRVSHVCPPDPPARPLPRWEGAGLAWTTPWLRSGPGWRDPSFVEPIMSSNRGSRGEPASVRRLAGLLHPAAGSVTTTGPLVYKILP